MSVTTYPDSQIVDEHDNPIGQMQLPEALRAGKILRVARVFVMNSKGQMLLQQRGPAVLSPGLWCESASGHVDVGESYLQTAERELEEEMGIAGTPLKEALYMFLEERGDGWKVGRFNTLYTCEYDGGLKVHDPSEVSGYRWVELAALDREVHQTPAAFTTGFVPIYTKYRKG